MKTGDIISHQQMCVREGRMLQRGMNFRVTPHHSVILMSRRSGAPYEDEVVDGGNTLIYEGHDVPRVKGVTAPKQHDQQRLTTNGTLTANGQFEQAAKEFKEGKRPAELVRVYEKIRAGIWTYNGVFRLTDVAFQRSEVRSVFKFRLVATDDGIPTVEATYNLDQNRLIPGAIKLEVYRRDGGRCVICGASDNLHFDHDFPFSKGGTSLSAKNIRLLCVRHNLEKRDKIE